MITEELIFTDLGLQTQEEVFQFLAKIAEEKAIASNQIAVYKGLKERENEGTTGMMDGFAIPHVKSDAVNHPAIIVAKLQQGIEWDSMDGQSTKYVIAMFIPTVESGETHLRILSQVARMLMKSEFKEAFIATNSRSALAAMIAEKLEE